MIPNQQAHIFVSARSHAGISGKNNEDRFAVSAFRTADKAQAPSVLAIVADGIGGHQAGEVAADLAVDTITHYIAQSDGKDPVALLSQSITYANQAIHEEAHKDQFRNGMGSTCICAWVIGNRLYTGSLGDSRLYLHRAGEFIQLNKDHTWIQEALEAGLITPDQVKDHPRAHIIRRYLGAPVMVSPDMNIYLDPSTPEDDYQLNQGLILEPDDQLLLCSDGLTDLVEDDEILKMLATIPPEQAVDELIDLANQRGGHDNITIVILTVPQSTHPFPEKQNALNSRRVTCFSLVSLSTLAVLGGLLFWYFAGHLVGLPPFPVTREASPTPTPAVPVILPTSAVTFQANPTLEPTQAKNTPEPSPSTASSTPAGPTPTYTPWPTNTQTTDS